MARSRGRAEQRSPWTAGIGGGVAPCCGCVFAERLSPRRFLRLAGSRAAYRRVLGSFVPGRGGRVRAKAVVILAVLVDALGRQDFYLCRLHRRRLCYPVLLSAPQLNRGPIARFDSVRLPGGNTVLYGMLRRF